VKTLIVNLAEERTLAVIDGALRRTLNPKVEGPSPSRPIREVPAPRQINAEKLQTSRRPGQQRVNNVGSPTCDRCLGGFDEVPAH
jgi:hypothetical protein